MVVRFVHPELSDFYSQALFCLSVVGVSVLSSLQGSYSLLA